MEYLKPKVVILGNLKELTGSGGNNNGDGWGYSKLA